MMIVDLEDLEEDHNFTFTNNPIRIYLDSLIFDRSVNLKTENHSHNY